MVDPRLFGGGSGAGKRERGMSNVACHMSMFEYDEGEWCAAAYRLFIFTYRSYVVFRTVSP